MRRREVPALTLATRTGDSGTSTSSCGCTLEPEPGVNTPGADDPGPVGESGWSADQRAKELRARGKSSAGAWEAGALGERRVAQALTALPPDWLVLHDRLLMPGRSETNLDHVVVGPAGTFLIDSKNWAGTITEYQGSVFKHTIAPGGDRRHTPLDRQFDGLFSMATEMARRIQVGVTVVIALSGRRAEQFGEPRLMRNVWVVPVGKLAGWLQSRQPAGIPDLSRLGVLVRTEFPSTTTDWQLLAAMGRDLDRRAPQRASTPSRKPRSRPPTRPTRRTPRRREKRTQRGGILRSLLALVGVAFLWWAASTGAFSGMGAAASRVMTDPVMDAVGSPPSAAPDRLSCADVDLASAGLSPSVKVVASPRSLGCAWTMQAKGGSTIAVLRLGELIGASESLDPMLKRSDTLGAPEIRQAYALGGQATYLWVRAGVPLSTSKGAPLASRSMHVRVAHEALGLTPKQGKKLAVRIATQASQRHPLPTG
jgi:nitrogen fixation-related uncharacterized protein